MVLLVSSSRKTHLLELVLLVSSSHTQGSFEEKFSFFPHNCKSCKDVFGLFLHKVKSYTYGTITVLIIIGKQLPSYKQWLYECCF